MEKRGQFYLVAALVIIAVIASLTVVYNETKVSDNDLVIYDLSKEINFEILQLLDGGYFNALTPSRLNDSINLIIESYSKTYPDTDIVLIYGDRGKVNVIAYYTRIIGEPCDVGSCTPITERIFYSETIDVSTQGSISFTINNITYPFNVEEYGQNFYLVLKKVQEGEIFLANTIPECNSDDDCQGQGNRVCISGSCESCGEESELCCPLKPNNPNYNGCKGQLECFNKLCQQISNQND